mmetsp:Transcript_1284/g.3328  ORF Transcript_1284/g.3328 Transcript_1284/m.3328 type:complete len:251 (-) Transcript_1284:1417-2169(-)
MESARLSMFIRRPYSETESSDLSSLTRARVSGCALGATTGAAPPDACSGVAKWPPSPPPPSPPLGPPPPSPPRAERPKSSPNLSADRAAPEPMRSAMDAPDPPEPEPTPKPDPTPVLLAPAPPLAEALAEGTPPAASAAFARLARLAASYALPSQLRLSVGASCPAPPLPAPDPASSAASASAGGCLRAMAPPRLPRASCVTSASPPPVCTSLSDTFLAESAVSPSPMNASSASASAPEIGSFSPVDAPC